MRTKKRPYVNSEDILTVKKFFILEQEKDSQKHVTKDQLFQTLKHSFKVNPNYINKPKISYRKMERAIDRLITDKDFKKIIIKGDRGQYWLKKVFELNAKTQKKINKQIKKEKNELQKQLKQLTVKKEKTEIELLIAKQYADLMKFCETKEDWELWRAFVKKMHENKEKQLLEEQREAVEARQEWEYQQWLKRDKEADKKMVEKAFLDCALKLAEQIKKEQKL